MTMPSAEQQKFVIIKKARAQLKAMPESKASQTTIEGYEREFNRLVGTSESREHMDLWHAVCDTTKKRTFYRRLAALRYGLRAQLSASLRRQDQAQRNGNTVAWRDEVEYLSGLLELATLMEQAKGTCPILDAQPRQSKRRTLRGLPSDWRHQMSNGLSTSKYHLAYLAEALTGCRPDELQRGVQVHRSIGHVEFIIAGSKVKATQGQPTRSIRYSTSDQHPLVQEILKYIPQQADAEITVSVANKVSYTSALRRVGKRLWPRRQSEITPYCLRHAAASDWKAHLPTEQVSAALGHAVDATASLYGQRQMGGGGSGLSPIGVNAERAIKPTRNTKPGHIDSKHRGAGPRT
ncbi:hypothetical protein ACQKFX_21335 [Cupriavidus metallidurans]|uniref:hypothetical protein n=1 Tax=Cupriavidus metallidurans TaxID=119219 RepID=UPI003CFDEFA5